MWSSPFELTNVQATFVSRAWVDTYAVVELADGRTVLLYLDQTVDSYLRDGTIPLSATSFSLLPPGAPSATTAPSWTPW